MPRDSKSVSIARRLVLLGLALGLATGLRPYGWGVEPEAGGTLTLSPPTGLPAPAAAAPERAAAPWEPQIREALTRRGWDLRRDAAGNLLLTPTGMGQVSA